jgi:hypothetical protein
MPNWEKQRRRRAPPRKFDQPPLGPTTVGAWPLGFTGAMRTPELVVAAGVVVVVDGALAAGALALSAGVATTGPAAEGADVEPVRFDAVLGAVVVVVPVVEPCVFIDVRVVCVIACVFSTIASQL